VPYEGAGMVGNIGNTAAGDCVLTLTEDTPGVVETPVVVGDTENSGNSSLLAMIKRMVEL
jgi:hypothetical protein